MNNVINGVGGYRAAASANKAYHKVQSDFKAALKLEQARRNAFTSTGQDWLYGLRSRYNVSGMGWMQGQRLVSELVGKGELSNDMLDLGARIIILFPPDAYDENGSLKIRDASDAVLLKMDEGYENTSDYIGTLKSSFEHHWEAYNGFVEKYGDIYPNVRNTLLEQDKLLSILQGMAST